MEFIILECLKLALQLFNLLIVCADVFLDLRQTLHLSLLLFDLSRHEFVRQVADVLVNDWLIQGKEIAFEFRELFDAQAGLLDRVCKRSVQFVLVKLALRHRALDILHPAFLEGLVAEAEGRRQQLRFVSQSVQLIYTLLCIIRTLFELHDNIRQQFQLIDIRDIVSIICRAACLFHVWLLLLVHLTAKLTLLIRSATFPSGLVSVK